MHILKVSMYRLAIMLAVVLCGLGAWLASKPSYAQTSAGPAQPMITQPVVESNLVRLFSNTRPEANAANDRGMVPDNLPMPHMMLQLRRPAA